MAKIVHSKHDFTIYEIACLEDWGFNLDDFDEEQQARIGDALDGEVPWEEIPEFIVDEVQTMHNDDHLREGLFDLNIEDVEVDDEEFDS